MKRLSIKIAMAALLLAVGSLGLNAQHGRGGNGGNGGNGLGGNGTGVHGSGNYTSLLNDEQKAALELLNVEFQEVMDGFREEMLAATTTEEKRAIFEEMAAAREAHIAEVKALLEGWGITVETGNSNRGFGKMMQAMKRLFHRKG